MALTALQLVRLEGGITFLKSKREKRPCFSVKTFRLVEDELNKIEVVEILYRGQRVENLSLSKLALWNRGNDTINATDIAPTDPLKIVLSDSYKLLAAEIIYVKTKANNFSILQDLEKGEIKIDFDYFHTNEGVMIQIYHTGKSNNDVNLVGTIKGVNKIPRIAPTEIYFTYSFSFVRLIESTLPHYITKGPEVIQWIAAFVVAMIIFPITVPLMVIDLLMRPVRRLPFDFTSE